MIIRVKKQGLYLTLGLFLVSYFKTMGMGSSDGIYMLVMLLSLGCAVIQIALDFSGYTKKQFIGLLLFLVLVSINYLITRDITLCITFIFFVAVRKVSLKKVLGGILLAKILGFMTNILLVKLGLKADRVVEFYREGFILRSDFGFGHANTFHFMFASIIMLLFLLYYAHIKWWHMVLILLANQYIYLFTSSRTGYFNVIVLILLFILMKTFLGKKIVYWFSLYAQFGFSIATYMLALVYYHTEFVQKIDKLLTGRLAFAHRQYISGVFLFGSNLEESGILFDNSYSMIFSKYGLLLTLVFLVFYYITVKDLIERRIDSLILFMGVFSIYLFTESYLPSAVVNLSWFVIAKVYFGQRAELEEEFLK